MTPFFNMRRLFSRIPKCGGAEIKISQPSHFWTADFMPELTHGRKFIFLPAL